MHLIAEEDVVEVVKSLYHYYIHENVSFDVVVFIKSLRNLNSISFAWKSAHNIGQILALVNPIEALAFLLLIE